MFKPQAECVTVWCLTLLSRCVLWVQVHERTMYSNVHSCMTNQIKVRCMYTCNKGACVTMQHRHTACILLMHHEIAPLDNAATG